MGIGSLAFLDLLSREARAAGNPLAAAVTHHAPRAKAVISLFMHGGPSQVDTFDPKPLLGKYAGQTLPASFANLNLEFTKTSTAKVLASKRTFKNGRQVDKPIAGLITDLKARGLLESTLIIWGGEFGRTPTSEGSDGRDHSPYGYSVWMAGGGIKGGTVFGATDDFGFKAVENPVQVRDLHATILHLLGLQHDKLTYYFQGLQQRLTQVDGESRVIKEILA